MSDSDEELNVRDEERQGGGEKVYLVREQDEETYSCRRFITARSFRLGMVISVLVVIVIVVALAATVAALLLTSSSSSEPSPSRKPNVITLDDLFDPDFVAERYTGTWTDDDKLLHVSSKNGLTLFDPSDGSTSTLISLSEWEELEEKLGPIFDVKLSHDQKWVMLVTNRESVYRHSFEADYFLYDLTSKTVSNITLPNNTTDRIQLAVWNPVQNVIAYVLGYNLYMYNISTGELVTITTDGAKNELYNGIPDWVYEEEVLSTNFALWWAPNGEQLLFAKFNDSAVEDFEFPLYGSYLDPSETQYTTIDVIAYPKPGTPNPLVSLMVVDPSNPSLLTSLPPPSEIADDHYFIFAGWVNSSVAMVTWMNRTSDSALYCFYPEETWECDLIYTQNSKAWIELIEPPTVVGEGGTLLALASEAQGDDSFTHIVEISSSSAPTWHTEGPWEVTTIVGATDTDILYISTETSPGQRHMYSTKKKSCLTCSQDGWGVPDSSNPSIPSRCDYFSASCSPSLTYCLLSCSGPAVPYTILMEYDGEVLKPIELMENNSKLHEKIRDLSLPTVDTFSVPETSDEPSLNGRIFYPPGFKSSNQYPVLVYVYAGPYSQQVSNRTILSSLSLLYFSSNLSMIVVSVDGRGTGYRGDNFKFAVYRDLGHYETIDQIRAGKYLQDLKYVEGSKLAIYGSSYGGYMAGMVGSSGSGVFSAAISQAPVTSWYYYDSIYTERYMLRPQDNQQGYEVSSVLGRAKELSDVDYLLIHGTGDDNVHFQHTAQLVEALTVEEIQFRLQFYTDEAHALSGTHTRVHLYELITDFLKESFHL